MVARITTPKRMMAALMYNENKVLKSKAVCLHANGFLRDSDELTTEQKAAGFERLNQRNDRAKTKTLHVSLNFHPSEKLSDTKLKAIAEAYMHGIGFNEQPYLVYRHDDAGHPHIHIVTTTIRQDGSRINTHNLGRNQSEKTRKEIENNFHLLKASSKKLNKEVKTVQQTGRLTYGKVETLKSINEIIGAVIQNYLFSSVPELNAILRKYNVQADTGSEQSHLHKHRGLNFQMLDTNGKPIGVPIKASSIEGKPTLKFLEKLFEKNTPLKEPFKQAIKTTIESAITEKPNDLPALKEILSENNIDLILRQSADGRIYGATFIDENNKVVINGSDLGKAYSADHLQSRLAANHDAPVIPLEQQLSESNEININQTNFLETLLTPEQEFNPLPGQLKKRKRKRRRKDLGF